MKKRLAAVLCCVLIVLLAAALVSCRKATDKNSPDVSVDKDPTSDSTGTGHEDSGKTGPDENVEPQMLIFRDVLSDGNVACVSVSGGKPDGNGKIAIPERHDGKPVIAIDETAFENCRNLVRVSIPSTVREIGERAFRDCPDLKTVKFVNGLEIIGERAFSGCWILGTIDLPSTVKSVGNNAFTCTRWETNQPDGVLYAGAVACDYKGEQADGLKITLRDGTAVIADSAFSGLWKLTSITLPESLKFIGESAMEQCGSLETINLPAGLEKIGPRAFMDSGLTSVTVPGNVKRIEEHAFDRCGSLSSATLEEGVEFIEVEAFHNCPVLAALEIPDSVWGMEYNAFGDTAWLNAERERIESGIIYAGKVAYEFVGDIPESGSVELADDTKGVADGIFYLEKSLESVGLNDGLEYIGNNAFDGTWLSSVVIPGSVRQIASHAFSYCTNLTEISIPAGIEFIDEKAFIGSSENLTKINVEEGAVYREIGNCLIKKDGGVLILGCASSEIPDDGTVTVLGNGAFSYGTMEEIEIPDAVTTIGDSAFDQCRFLKRITGFGGVETIMEDAFNQCENLEEIENTGTVRNIGGSAFYKCEALKSIAGFTGVEVVGEEAFYGCTALEELPDFGSIRKMERDALENTAWLNAAAEDENNRDTVIYAGNVAYKYNGDPEEEYSVEIKPGTVALADGIFWYDGLLTAVTLPDTLKHIGDNAFASCSKLTSIVLPAGLESIGSYALSYSQIETIEFEDTADRWKTVEKASGWCLEIPAQNIKCTDAAVPVGD